MLLDLFAGAGGCTVGYQRAGFTVTAVDLNANAIKRNPADTTMVADALELLAQQDFLAEFDVIHASPPCQAYSITKHAHDREHPDLYQPVKDALVAWGGTWVIENVPGVPMMDAVTLCGSMFDLTTWDDYINQPVQLQRHRLFESNVLLMAPGPCRHKDMRVGGVYGGAWSKNKSLDPTIKRTGGYAPPDHVQRELMGIDWMTRQQLNQAIPPVYTEFLGRQLIDALAVTS
jgi:DNA (cytosine-5)-methyltransferase 1